MERGVDLHHFFQYSNFKVKNPCDVLPSSQNTSRVLVLVLDQDCTTAKTAIAYEKSTCCNESNYSNQINFWHLNSMQHNNQQFFQEKGVVRTIRGFVTITRYILTKHITGYYNQANPQTAEGQQTFSNLRSRFAKIIKAYCTFGNPRSSSAETVEGQYMFGNPPSSSAETVEGQYTFANPPSSSAETVEGQYTFSNPRSSSAVTVGVQQIFGNDCSSLVDVQKCT